LAKSHGLQVQFICTFTSYSVQFKEQIFNHFLENGWLSSCIRFAVPAQRRAANGRLSGEVRRASCLFDDRYLENLNRIEIRNINDYCRCVLTRRGTVCTFVDCMENTFAVGPDGSIIHAIASWACRNMLWPRPRLPQPEDLAESAVGLLMRHLRSM